MPSSIGTSPASRPRGKDGTHAVLLDPLDATEVPRAHFHRYRRGPRAHPVEAQDGSQLGRGYGHATEAGLEALRLLRETEQLELDTTYSAKSMAAALARVRAGLPGPLVYWATKSTVPLPEVREDDWRWAPPLMTRWIERAERECAPP